MRERPSAKWPIWVSIVFALLFVDVLIRLIDWIYAGVYSGTSLLVQSGAGWFIANLAIFVASSVALIAILQRRPIGRILALIALIFGLIELVLGTWLGEYESSLEFGIMVGFDAAISIFIAILVERLLRSAAVHEFFGIVDPDHPVRLNEPPPPPTFAE